MVLLSYFSQKIVLGISKQKYQNKNSTEDVQEEPQSQNLAYQLHQEEEQTNHDRQYTTHKPKKSKATNSFLHNKVFIVLDRIHQMQQRDNEQDKTWKKFQSGAATRPHKE